MCSFRILTVLHIFRLTVNCCRVRPHCIKSMEQRKRIVAGLLTDTPNAQLAEWVMVHQSALPGLHLDENLFSLVVDILFSCF